ncbi:MAG: PIN domain-containing protein [Chloroflexota bacterium]
MNVALDTNVLAYAEAVNGQEKHEAARELLRGLPRDSVRLPVQALGELFRILVKKAGRRPEEARQDIVAWTDAYDVTDVTAAVLLQALELATSHGLFVWDAVVLASAAAAGCRLLLSEDMHSGFTWNGTTVVNPFAPVRHPLLEAAMQG